MELELLGLGQGIRLVSESISLIQVECGGLGQDREGKDIPSRTNFRSPL